MLRQELRKIEVSSEFLVLSRGKDIPVQWVTWKIAIKESLQMRKINQMILKLFVITIINSIFILHVDETLRDVFCLFLSLFNGTLLAEYVSLYYRIEENGGRYNGKNANGIYRGLF